MGPIYATLCIAGWAFLVGLLGYVYIAVKSPRRRERARGVEVLIKDEGPKES